MFRKFLIKKDERGLLFRKGDFVTVLHAGEHRYFDPFMRLTVEKYPLAKTSFDHRLADYLRHAEPALETLEKVTEKIDRISVCGGLDSVLKDLVKIRA